MREELQELGWDEAWADAFRELRGASEGQPARVTSQQRDRWMIHSAEGPRLGRLLGSQWGGDRPVTGDWIVCTPGPESTDPWGIVGLLPRRSAIVRGAAGGSQSAQVLAANVDRLWIVQSMETPPNVRSLERYLAVAWESGAVPEIVLTKADLSSDVGTALAEVRAIAFDVPVWAVSIQDAEAVEGLRDGLGHGQTVALLGPSGAGKSTLINHLAAEDLARVGAVRSTDRKGRHTTTARELFRIDGGALLLDTPGMRELKILDPGDGLRHTFPEIDDLAGDCRFRDCSHSSEPGCAVLSAAEEGRLAPERLASYQKLQAEAAYERRRADPRKQAEHVAEHKTALRTLRFHPKYRDRE